MGMSMVVLRCVCSINQAWREVFWASDLWSNALRELRVCSCPFLMVEAGVADGQGAVYDSPDSRHSSQLQLGWLALGRGLVHCLAMNAVIARGHNDVHHFARRLCCLLG